jgi:hypothetical protein
MIHLAWKQTEDNHILLFIPVRSELKAFQMDFSVINFLASFKKLQMHVRTDGSEEKIYGADFSGLQPRAGVGGKEISVNVEGSSMQPAMKNCCAISRGDTYSDRWLGPDGWNETAFWFALTPAPRYEKPAVVSAGVTAANSNTSENKTGTVNYSVDAANYTSVNRSERTKPFAAWLVAFGIGCAILMFVTPMQYRSPIMTGLGSWHFFYILSLFLVSFCGAVTSFLGIVYRCWKLLRKNDGSVPPDQALWLMLLPLFNLYWSFRAVAVLPAKLNETLAGQVNRPGQKKKFPFGAIVLCCAWILLFSSLIVNVCNYQFGLQLSGVWGWLPLSGELFNVFLMITGLRLNKLYYKVSLFKVTGPE